MNIIRVKLRFILLLGCLFALIFTLIPSRSSSQTRAAKTDTLSIIINSTQSENRDHKILDLLANRFLRSSQYDNQVYGVSNLFKTHSDKNEAAYLAFAQALVCRRVFKYEAAQRYLLSAIKVAQASKNNFLLFKFYSNMAFVQTDIGQPLAAIFSYRLARKTAEALGKQWYLANTDLNIADLYTKLHLYSPALYHLNLASAYAKKDTSDPTFLAYVNSDKADVFFKIKQLDSLSYYAMLVAKGDNNVYDITRLRKKMAYYQLILQKRYPEAIAIIRNLLLDVRVDRNTDRWNLAETYYLNHNIDSARIIATDLINDRMFHNPELEYEARKLFSVIATESGDYKTAALQRKAALDEADSSLNKVIILGNASSEMRLGELESAYLTQETSYEKERTLLFFAIVVAVLLIVVTGLLYFNIRQKHRYEKIINEAKKHELAFLNSHELRKHSANILGLCVLLNDEITENEEAVTLRKYLTLSAKQMDDTIITIEKKLGE